MAYHRLRPEIAELLLSSEKACALVSSTLLSVPARMPSLCIYLGLFHS